MRKTLTVISLVIAATSLAACKKFWEHDPAPPAAATATTPTPTAEGSKPVEPTAYTSTDKAVPPYGEKTETPPVPAEK